MSIKKWLWTAATSVLLAANTQAAVNPEDLLSPEEAFVPTISVSEKGIDVQFNIADGYYLYQSKITADANPSVKFAAPQFSQGEQKEDEFFGKQIVYHHAANVKWDYAQVASNQYTLNVHYQGCAEAGICYPPVDSSYEITGVGTYGGGADVSGSQNSKDLFVKKPQADVLASSSNVARSSANADALNVSGSQNLSREHFWANIFWFFVAGLGLSFTACMYPLLPIVSSIVVGDKSGSKKRAAALSFVYVQGLALTYTVVGVVAGLTGALLTVLLQQAWVVLTMAALMVVLALSMFGLFNIQLPNSVQSYFQNQSNKLSGGKIASVFVMGMLSALIVGPCVAPPLAAALGYIGKTGDALLGGILLYAMAFGTGIPLMIVGTFGGHILPRAGDWMNGIKYAFGVILLAVAVYLATPFLPYKLVLILYAMLLICPALYLLLRLKYFSGSLKNVAAILGIILLVNGVWFSVQSLRGQSSPIHEFLTLHEPAVHSNQFTDVTQLHQAIEAAFAANPNEPVLLDFYADWCVSCKEMEAKTFNQASVQAVVPMSRLFQLDVTAATPEQKVFLKEYGLFGPPGLFVLKSDGSHSEGLLGYVPADEFIAWYNAHK